MMARVAVVIVPNGYKSAAEFAQDIGVELIESYETDRQQIRRGGPFGQKDVSGRKIIP